MSDVINGVLPLSAFYLFQPVSTAPNTFDASKKPKSWAVPADFDLAAHGIQDFGDFVLFPMSLFNDGIHPITVKRAFIVPKSELYSLNIVPPAKMPGLPAVPGTIQDPYPIPLDPQKWDAENYYVSAEGPLGALIVVRDHRRDESLPTPFTVGDQRRLARIEEALKK